MDNVQKHNICTNVSLSQMFRSYLQELQPFFLYPFMFQALCESYTRDDGLAVEQVGDEM
jgi:hypothetical protein